MPLLVGLLGGECTGKSTLAAALAAQIGAEVVPEAVRAFVQQHGRAPHRDEQAGVLARQSDAVARAVAAAARDAVVVVDPAPLMTAVYSVLYFEDDSLVAEGVDDALAYDVLAWCAPDVPWRADPGVRDGPHYRAAADRILSGIATTTLGPRGAHVVRVTGDLDVRVATVRDAVTAGRDRAGVAPPGPSGRNLDSHG